MKTRESNVPSFVKLWSAKSSLHFDTHLAHVYAKLNFYQGKSAYNNVIFIYTDGVTNCWVSKADRDNVGLRLRISAEQDKGYIGRISKEIISCGNKIRQFIDSNDPISINLDSFSFFWDLVYEYYLRHIIVKYIGDYMDDKDLKKFIKILEKARLATEPIYREIEDYWEQVSAAVANRVGCSKEMIMSMTKEEFRLYLKSKTIPNLNVLKARYLKSALILNGKNASIVSGSAAEKHEKLISKSFLADNITGA